MYTPLTRRDALKTLGAFSAGGALGALALWSSAKMRQVVGPKDGVLRLAHLTDVHVRPGNRSGAGLAACLRHVQALDDPPDLILNGGDAISDALDADEAEVRAQWRLWQRVVRDECGLPIEHCLGNHDVWGGPHGKGSAGAAGKQWALDALGLAARYRSFDRAGWHFVVLDSTFLRGDGYEARLDDEQFAWLKADLRAVPEATPVLVLSHAPILAACVFFDGDNEKAGNWVVPGAWMHLDARRLKDLFAEHANVKLCLSGHIHLRDRVEYQGVTYLCNGAVSGAWWNGAYQGCEPGYAVLDLKGDGSFAYHYLTYDA